MLAFIIVLILMMLVSIAYLYKYRKKESEGYVEEEHNTGCVALQNKLRKLWYERCKLSRDFLISIILKKEMIDDIKRQLAENSVAISDASGVDIKQMLDSEVNIMYKYAVAVIEYNRVDNVKALREMKDNYMALVDKLSNMTQSKLNKIKLMEHFVKYASLIVFQLNHMLQDQEAISIEDYNQASLEILQVADIMANAAC